MIYRHNKTGHLYRHLAHAIDCTNSRDGLGVVVYCRDDNEHAIYVRDAEEFAQRFTPVTDDE